MSTPANYCEPLFKPGADITGHASAAVTGKRFVRVSGPVQAGPDLNTSVSGGNVLIAHAAAGTRAFGVVKHDAAIDTDVLVHTGGVLPVTAEGTITAGTDLVQVGTDGKAKKYTPGSGAAATATSGVVADNNALTYTARDAGAGGNGVSVQLKDPAGNSQSLSVTVNGNDIVVNLATDGSGVITSTATLVKAAIEASAGANSLVSVAHTSTSTGAGVVVAQAATPLTGGDDALAVGIPFNSVTNGQDVFVKLF